MHAGSPEYQKWQAVATANLSAAILCNHTKKDTGNWEARKQRYEERIVKAQERLERYRGQVAERKEKLQVLEVEAASKRAIAQARLDKVPPDKEARLEKAQILRLVDHLEPPHLLARVIGRLDRLGADDRATAALGHQADGVGEADGTGGENPAARDREARATIASVYSQAPRDPIAASAPDARQTVDRLVSRYGTTEKQDTPTSEQIAEAVKACAHLEAIDWAVQRQRLKDLCGREVRLSDLDRQYRQARKELEIELAKELFA